MKKILFIVVFAFIFIPYSGRALHYTDDFPSSIRYGQNSTETINKAKLLEKYTREYVNNLQKIRKLFEINTSSTLDEAEKELELIVDVLIKTQSQYIVSEDAETLIASTIAGIKKINIRVEPYIKRKQQEYKEHLSDTKRKYIVVGNKISAAVFTFIKKISAALSAKKSLSIEQQEVVKSLARLNESREKIKKFEQTRFQTKQEMKSYYIEIIKSIRQEIKTIKNLLD